MSAERKSCLLLTWNPWQKYARDYVIESHFDDIIYVKKY